MNYNLIKCKGVEGIYKDRHFEIFINKDDYQIRCHGRDLNGVKKMVITLEENKVTKLELKIKE